MSTGFEHIALRNLYALGYARGVINAFSDYIENPMS